MDNGASSYRRFLDGEKEAFDEIMKELFFGLVCFVNSYVHNVHTAEDIAMDCFTELIVRPRRYNFKVSLKTYLYMLGKSRAIDHLRRRRLVSLDDIPENEKNTEETEELENTVIDNERKAAVNSAMKKLPDDMREAVYLVYFEDMSYEDAAKVMKKSKKQVDNLIYRAKKELKNILDKDVI